MCATFHESINQCEPAGAPLDGAELADAEALGAAGTSDCAEVGATGTSDCAGTDDAGAELPAPAMMPSVC